MFAGEGERLMKTVMKAMVSIAMSGGLAALVAGGTAGGGLLGFMTGGGSIIDGDLRVTHGFHLNCTVTNSPQRLEINWDGNQFHLDSLTSANCSDNPALDQGQPAAVFNTFNGSGVGTYDGVPGATVQFTFTDAGEPGVNDFASYYIVDANGNLVLIASGTLDNGNQQAHK
jgi:hypothetical protein